MQAQNELLLLSDFMKFLKHVYSAQFWDNPEFYYKAFNKWKSDNNIASVEPEPLAKNKQAENENFECEHSWSYKPILQQYNCRKCGKWR